MGRLHKTARSTAPTHNHPSTRPAKNWLRLPCIIYGAHVATTLVPILDAFGASVVGGVGSIVRSINRSNRFTSYTYSPGAAADERAADDAHCHVRTLVVGGMNSSDSGSDPHHVKFRSTTTTVTPPTSSCPCCWWRSCSATRSPSGRRSVYLYYLYAFRFGY